MTRGSRTLHAEIPLHHVGPLIPVAFVNGREVSVMGKF
jgi:hypothetical protein